MDCPVCKKAMVILEYGNVELDFCVSCEGCWVDRGELGLILHGRMDLPNDWTLVAERKSRRRCARCGSRMREGEIAGTGVVVDVCPNQHGLWFDKGEIQRVAQVKAPEGNAAAISRFCAEVFGNMKEPLNTAAKGD